MRRWLMAGGGVVGAGPGYDVRHHLAKPRPRTALRTTSGTASSLNVRRRDIDEACLEPNLSAANNVRISGNNLRMKVATAARANDEVVRRNPAELSGQGPHCNREKPRKLPAVN